MNKYLLIFGPPPSQTVPLESHAFRSVKARVTASETAREMCAYENEDLVEKACLNLFDGRYLESSTMQQRKKSHQKKGCNTYFERWRGLQKKKKTKKNSTGQKVNMYIAHSSVLLMTLFFVLFDGIHALMTSIKQDVFEVKYVHSSEEG